MIRLATRQFSLKTTPETCMNSNPSDSVADYLAFAHELADAAGAAVLPHFRKKSAIDNKLEGGFDPVTEADRAAEREMRKLIEARYPDHGIVGEEFPRKEGVSTLEWILDPVDGTRSFVFGMTTWTTLIGLLDDGTPLAGMMNQPYVGERFYGSSDGAFWQRGSESERLSVKPAGDLASALISTTAPALYKTEREAQFLQRMIKASRSIRYDADAYFFCLLAAGHIDVALDAGLQSYDIAPLVPIIEAAGGIVTTWDGEPATAGGNIIAAASRQLYEEALSLLP